jgi:hypothetical protein
MDKVITEKKRDIIKSVVEVSAMNIVQMLSRYDNIKFPGDPIVATIDGCKAFIYFDRSNDVVICNIEDLEARLIRIYSR